MPNKDGRPFIKDDIWIFVSVIVLSIKILFNKNPNKAVVQLTSKTGKSTPASILNLV